MLANVGIPTRAQSNSRGSARMKEEVDLFFSQFLPNTAGNIALWRMVWNAESAKYDPVKRIFTRDIQGLKDFIETTDGDLFHNVNLIRLDRTTTEKEDISEVIAIAVDV